MYNPSLPYRILLWPISVIYGALVRFRNLLYLKGILKRARPSGVRIISVGNITVGGTGKTPVTLHLADRLKEMGIKVAILSRGYQRTTTGPKVVSDGERLLMGPSEAGDEPYLMARRLKGVPVVVSERRTLGAELVKERFNPQVIILDDGFQHLAIERDLDIVLLDGRILHENPYLLPAGPVREPASSLKRADIVLLKGGAALPHGFAHYINGKPLWGFHYRADGLLDKAFREAGGPELLEGRPILAVCGIAEPASFFATLEACGAEIRGRLAFPDHHGYTSEDVAAIKESVEKTGAEWVVTTEKDGVKLTGCKGVDGLPLFVLTVDVAIDREEEFMAKIMELSGIET